MGKLIIRLGICLLLLFASSCSREKQAQGYVEGRYTYMATSVSGILKQLPVKRGSRVASGDLLFVLEERPESDVSQAALEELNQSIAARDAIIANLSYAKITYERNKILVPKKAIQQSALDNAASIYGATYAQLEQANAAIATTAAQFAQAKWMQAQKIVRAPVDATVIDTYYRLGEYTEASKPVLALLALRDNKVVFFIEEADLGKIHLNDEVSVHCDGCKENYIGRISFISPTAEYTPPVIYSNETSAKLIYRIEAEFSNKDAINLHPGQPILVNYLLNS